MNLREILTGSALLLALVVSTTSCASMRRAGKDAGIVVISPVLIPYGGFTDGYTAATAFQEGLDAGPTAQVLAMPFTVIWHSAGHLLCVFVHALDFCALPIYGAADLHPYGPEIEPLDYYQGTWFDKGGMWSGTDPETGESR